MIRHLFTSLLVALFAMCGMLAAVPASAIDGEILLTQAKAAAGGVTPTDTAGFPITLSLSGSYKFAGNLSPGPNLIGIVVTAPDVTIDLNGFELSGGPAGGANNARHGIVGQGDRLTVKNGTIGAFRYSGIYAVSREYLIVENMRIINGGYGIYNAGGARFARIQNSTIASNTNVGITCGRSCHIEGNVVSGNGSYGVNIETGTVLGNTIIENGYFGITAVAASAKVGVGNNTLVDNAGTGGQQIQGAFSELHPNLCFPTAC